MIRVNEIKFKVEEPFNELELKKKIATKLKISKEDIVEMKIVRESIDARKDIFFTYTVDFVLNNEKKYQKLKLQEAPKPIMPIHETLPKEVLDQLALKPSPVIIGFGPGGIFAALQLAKAGLKPIVFEMGEAVPERDKAVDKLWQEGILNPKSNVQFGEGGAGTYSDGKLTTRIKDPRVHFVLEALVSAGAPEEILYKQKPHVGTDILKDVVQNIRKEIIALGGQIHFNSEVTDLIFSDDGNAIAAVEINEETLHPCQHVIAATGHSSRAFYYMLKDKGFSLSPKPFAVGVRIEHPQEMINASQFGAYYQASRLGAAEYKLSCQTTQNRSVYSFCMCPGGTVVASASEEGRLVVNGMSYSRRDLYNANSALLVTVEPSDFGSDDVLAGIEFQRKLEEKAYEVGGGGFCAPVQTVGSFLNQMSALKKPYGYIKGFDYDKAFRDLKPTYEPKTQNADLSEVFPDFVTESLKEALPVFGRKIKGYDDPRALMTAVESRSSAPVRVNRDSITLEAIDIKGFYPCGEGAGYAGGITSAAVDGVKIAENIIKSFIQE